MIKISYNFAVDPDDLLATTTRTYNYGNFTLEGTHAEWGNIEVYVVLKHNCSSHFHAQKVL